MLLAIRARARARSFALRANEKQSLFETYVHLESIDVMVAFYIESEALLVIDFFIRAPNITIPAAQGEYNNIII